jgi:hypothetical protein
MSNKFLGLDSINVLKAYIDTYINKKLDTLMSVNRTTRNIANNSYPVESRISNSITYAIDNGDVVINDFNENSYYITSTDKIYTIIVDTVDAFNNKYNNKVCKFVNVGTGEMLISSPYIQITDNINSTNEIILSQGECIELVGINDNECKFLLIGKSIIPIEETEIIVDDTK